MQIIYFTWKYMWNWGYSTSPLNSYIIIFVKTGFDNLPKEGSKQLTWNSWLVKNRHWPWMYSVVFLTQFWPTCWMVHCTFERLISSWYTYEIKIHIRYLLPQVWNKIIAHLTTYKNKKKWDIEPKPCALRRTRTIHKVKVWDF